MKLFDDMHIGGVATRQYPLYNNETPPDDGGLGSKMLKYLSALERTLSPKAARAEAGMSLLAYEECSLRSVWFCKMINAIATHSEDEVLWATLSRGSGFSKMDEDGNACLDADGKVIRVGASDIAAKLVVENRLRVATSGGMAQLAGAPDFIDADYSTLSREQIRQLQIAEQTAIINAHRPASLAGDPKASEIIIKASDRLAKLAGTDQPRLIASFHANGDMNRLTDAELEQIAAGGLTLVPDANGVYSAEGE